MKSDFSQTDKLVWIFSDTGGLRQRLFQRHGFRTIHMYHDLHSRKQCQDLLNELDTQKPQLLWIRFAGPCAGSGNKHDALRAEHLVRMINVQRSSGRSVVVEASERSQVWNLQAVRECMSELCQTSHQWCNYEKESANQHAPCCSRLKLLTSFPMPDRSQCSCSSTTQHVHQKDLGKSSNSRFVHVLSALIDLTLKLPQVPIEGQPELKLPEELNTDERGVRKSVRFSSLHSSKKFDEPPVFDPEITRSSNDARPSGSQSETNASQDFWLRSGAHTLMRVHVLPRSSLFSPHSQECPVDVSLLTSSRQTRMQPVNPTGTMPLDPVNITDQWSNSAVSSQPFDWIGTTMFELTHTAPQTLTAAKPCQVEHSVHAFPTEGALRQKQRKAAGHVVKPKTKLVEQHADDCGQDLSSLVVDGSLNVDEHVSETASQHFVNEQQCFDEISSLFQDARSFGFGSDSEAVPAFWSQYGMMSMQEAFHARSSYPEDGLDCIELFGGKGSTTMILAKHHNLRTGINFELLAGVDLSKAEDLNYLWTYILRNKPKVIILAPPCRGYTKWGHINKKINHEAWLAGRRLSVPLAKLSGKIAKHQLQQRRHFIVEQPHGSGLVSEPEWQEIAPSCHSVVFDQCMVGLRMKREPFLPVRKTTECWASDPLLLMHLQNLRCDGSHMHAHIGSWSNDGHPTVKSSDMQIWPLELCQRIAAGVAECIVSMFASLAFPASKAKKDEGEAKDVCPGCRGHLRKSDPKHTRGPGCKFPDVVPEEWTCPGCKNGKHRAHESHTNDVDCKWALARTMPEGASRERGSAHPRDGRIPASADPSSSLRLEGREDGVPGAVVPAAEVSDAIAPIEPERLTPEEATRRRREKGESRAPVRRFVDNSVQAEAPMPGSSAAAPEQPAPEEGAIVPVRDDVASWSRHDLGFALQQLRSIREGVVRRTLRKLHIRWYHCPSRKMQNLLEAAGVRPEVLSLVPSIIDTCSICRNWQRVGPKSATTTRLPTAFNAEVQVDLLFYKDKVILHCIDACIRWSAACVLADRMTPTVLDGFFKTWIQPFGPPSVVLSDQEGGLNNDEAGDWFERKGIQHLPKAKNQHCGVVERHNEILRRQLHLVEDQSNSEGLPATFDMLLAEAVSAKNALFQIGNATPYEALYGRSPPLVNVMLEENGEMVSDRDAARVRQISISSMIQATADVRTRIANDSRTRRAGELLELKQGDMVEFFRKPMNKDTSGWHGPAEVINITSMQDGIIHVKWQGRVIAVRIQDARRALMYHAFLMRPSGPVKVLKAEVEAHRGQALRLGWVRQGPTWLPCQGNSEHAELLAAGLYVAACCLHLEGVIGFRCGTEIANLPAVSFDDTLLLWWSDSNLGQWFHCFTPGNKFLNVAKVTGDDASSIVQFLMVDQTEVTALRQVAPDVRHLGGTHEPSLPMLCDKTDEVIKSHGPKALQNTPTDDERPQESSEMPMNSEATGESSNPSHSEVPTSTFLDCEDCFPDEVSYNFDYMSIVKEPTFLGTTYVTNCPHATSSEPDMETVMSASELDEPPQIAFPAFMSHLILLGPNANPIMFDDDHMLVFTYQTGQPAQAVIERVNNVLTRDEALTHVEECKEAMLLELGRWIKHKAWQRSSRVNAKNALKSKWVLKWKDIGQGTQKARKIKARLVAQGFLDQQTTSTFAGTSTRWSQRLLIAFAVQMQWNLWSCDISEAFLRGLSFKELHETEGMELRQVELILPPGGEHLLRCIDGYHDFNPDEEVLTLLKPGFGLKDAPRLWLLALRKVLFKIGAVASQVDPQLFFIHSQGKLRVMLSVHVDDIKLCGEADVMKTVVEQLEAHFDSVKLEKDKFLHLGLQHSREADGTITVDQSHYIKELRSIPDDHLKLMDKTALVNERDHHLFMSLLGGLAWVVQTRPDVAIFVGALQRKLQSPCVQDVLDLNRVMAYVKAKPMTMKFVKLNKPWKLIAISDSGYKGEGQDCLAVKSGMVCLVDRDFPVSGANNIQIIEFVSKKQSRICRSTFAAEILSALDLTGLLLNVSLLITELLIGPTTSAKLADMHDSGTLPLETELVIDAASVFESAISVEPKVPNDATRLIHVLKLRELMSMRQLSRLHWIDARCMLADGLNKGSVDRAALQKAISDAVWMIDHDFRSSQVPKAKPSKDNLS